MTHELLRNRGPDIDSSYVVQHEAFDIYLAGYVLWQQGDSPCQQPLVKQKYVLLMNGDIYSKRGAVDQSDTEWLLDSLNKCQTIDDILELFRTIEGPYSIVIYDQSTSETIFVRDSLGRQTLLLAKRSGCDGIVISSVIGKFWSPAIHILIC